MAFENCLSSIKKLVLLGGVITFISSFTSLAQAAKLADIMFVIDVSRSIEDEIGEVKNRIIQFEQVLVSNDIDALYGLTTFGNLVGSGEKLVQDFVDFSVFTAAGGEFQELDFDLSSTERGVVATRIAFDNASFRDNSVKNFILITDEKDQTLFQEFDRFRDRFIQDNTVIFNFIGDLEDSPRYNTLANDTGGQGFEIEEFINNPEPFFNNFINVKSQEIISASLESSEPPISTSTSTPEPSFLLSLFAISLFSFYLTKSSRDKI